MTLLAALTWPILERIHLVDDFAVSPHGIGIAAGVLAGAQVMLRRAQRRGIARRPVSRSEIAEVVQALMTRAVIGGILGARLFYVLTHLELFPDPLSWLRIWEGGLSLLGGVTGAVLAGLPYAWRRRLSVALLLDSVAPGLALGIVIGRIGDLIIGEHLGGRTDFFLGWRCAGAVGDPAAPYPWPGPRLQGCFDVPVHQTALYDFLAAGVVFAVLLLAERKPRFDGFFTAAFVVLYGAGRFLTDFARTADKDLIGTLTGSQVTVPLAIAATLLWMVISRPHQRPSWAWTPPSFNHGWVSTDEPSPPPPVDDQPARR